MLFNSWEFIFLVVPVMLIYYQLGLRGQNILLLIASYLFYGAWEPRFLALLALSTVIDYCAGLALMRHESPATRKLIVGFSVAANLGILGFFKYYGFFVASAGALLSAFGLEPRTPVLNVILPIGISFYTFQTMAYTIDVYRRRFPAERDLLDFALFVSFFPQLVAGPIERAERLLPQLRNVRTVAKSEFLQGVWLVACGYFKKLVIADSLAPHVDRVFAHTGDASVFAVWWCMIAFAVQIYADFSGYTDIARGLGKLMGIELSRNFRLPLLAQTHSEFWSRWHITLTEWFRDYLFRPLVGAHPTVLRSSIALLLTMTAIGFWHGPNLTFILFGLWAGLLLLGERLFRRLARRSRRQKRAARAGRRSPVVLLRTLICFHLFWPAGLLFRAPDVGSFIDLMKAFGGRFHLTGGDLRLLFVVLLFGGLSFLFDLVLEDTDDPRELRLGKWAIGPAAFAILLVLLYTLAPGSAQTFVYFRF